MNRINLFEYEIHLLMNSCIMCLILNYKIHLGRHDFIKTSIITFKQVISTTSIRLEVVIFPIQAELEITTVSKNDDRVVNHYNWSWSIWHLHNNTLKIGLLSLFNVLCVNLIPPPKKKTFQNFTIKTNVPKMRKKN